MKPPIARSAIVRITQHFDPPAHMGIDYSCLVGTPIYAAADGVAYRGSQPSGFGLYIRLECAGAVYIYTAHLNAWAVADNARVRAGDVVGYSGNTGNSTGPHLHFEVRKGSRLQASAVDPEPMIEWEDEPVARRVAGVHLGNDCPLRDRDRETIRRLRPGVVVLMPSYGVNQQRVSVADALWILSVVPDCHIILRPYVPPSMAATDAGCQEYIAAVLAMLPEWVRAVPEGQLHLQLWNEQNMPVWAGWEGFGDQLADMIRFDRMFVAAYTQIKGAYPSVLIGWTPLTIGNRDCWFPGDMAGHYYLHGPMGCAEPYTLTAAQRQLAREESPCYQSLKLADEHYHHIYVHDRDGVPGCWNHDAYGCRYARYHYWWPEKAIRITEWGHPNKHFLQQPGMVDALVQHAELLQSVSYIKGAALWLLGDNAQWGGEMYAPDASVVARLAEVNAVVMPEPAPEPIPEPEPEPTPYLPSTDPLTLAAITSGDVYQMHIKDRWWREDAVRKLESGDTPSALAIMQDLVDHAHGLAYIIERALAPT